MVRTADAGEFQLDFMTVELRDSELIRHIAELFVSDNEILEEEVARLHVGFAIDCVG